MPRSKPRYPKVIDDALVEVAERYKVEIFALETYCIGLVMAAYLEDMERVDEKRDVSKICTKIGLQSELLPASVVVQQVMPF
jgi:hypothetical protein